MKNTKKWILIIILLTLVLMLKNILNKKYEVYINELEALDKAYSLNVPETDITNIQKAIQEVAYSFYMRGANIQYNSMKGNLSWYSPEEATSNNTNYLVCSAFTKNVYYELLGIKIPPYTDDLLEYGREHVGNSEVVAYGNKVGNNFVMKIYDENSENKFKELQNPSLEDIIPYLQIRRCYNIHWTCNDGI